MGPASLVVGLQANSNKVTKIGLNSVQFSNGDSSFIADPGFGDVEVQAGTFSLYGYVGLGDPDKTITVRSNATLQVDNTGDSLTIKPIVLDDGATFSSALPNRLMPQYCTVPGPISLGGADKFKVVSTDTVTLNGEVGGSGSLITTGPGLLVLNASNSFTGDLNIQAGTVALTSDASVTKAPNIVLAGTTLDVSGRSDAMLTLASGQTLKGSGTIVGTLVSPIGTTVTPGASVGAIAVTGGATLGGSTVMEISKVAAVYGADLLSVSATLDLGGTLTVTYSGDNLQAGDTFTLFAAGAFANAFTNVSLPVISGVVWTNMTAIDGTVRVLSAPVPAQPTVSGGTALPGGSFQLDFSGPSGYGYSVRASTDVTQPASSWPVVGNGTFGASPANFIDLNAPTYERRFYLISIP
jgi:autotransporter-associated beta strand protein